MENVEFAQDLKRMMDAWDHILRHVVERYPNGTPTFHEKMTERLFEKLVAGLDKNKGRG